MSKTITARKMGLRGNRVMRKRTTKAQRLEWAAKGGRARKGCRKAKNVAQ